MSQRTAKFASALVASILAGANLTAFAENGAKQADAEAADTCLASPKGAAPEGSRWRYRIDHATKRHCWYLRTEKDKATKTATASPHRASPTKEATVEDTAPPPEMRPAVADARAELVWPQTGNVPQSSGSVAPQSNGAASDTSARTATADATQSSTVATRWLDPSSVGSSNSRAASADGRVASADPVSPAPATTDAAPSPAPSPAPAAVAAPAPEKQSASSQMLLIVMAGALALAGLIGGVLFRVNRSRTPPYEVENEWRAPWDAEHAERPSPSIFPGEDTPVQPALAPRSRRAESAAEQPALDDAERIRAMLARLARNSAT